MISTSTPNFLELIKSLRMNDRKAYYQLRQQFSHISLYDGARRWLRLDFSWSDTVSFLHQAKTRGVFVIRQSQTDLGHLILSVLVIPNFDPECRASLNASIIDYEITYRKRFQRYEIFDKEKDGFAYFNNLNDLVRFYSSISGLDCRLNVPATECCLLRYEAI
ncbi:uncharacterized protein TRIADDRAFT_54438 [Trichoplax adhaerens]|uniref:SH2 domain-containing protein n=1 Tax=Trichoplax adhaerens TaxID=10228 RepID=B3RS13_TRIAD|nr:predicted protein [Trichoplax adhaerens]EDV26968.1 predicted protein [Trichoplax adhaerens]|eukprot:XP_002110964.1 predicted protein [Trichoplax adhaerens]